MYENVKFNQEVSHFFRSAHASIIRVAAMGVSLLFGIVAAKFLGSSLFGDYVSLMTAAGLITVALSFGLPILISREVAASRGSGDKSTIVPLLQGVLSLTGLAAVTSICTFLLGLEDLTLVFLFVLTANLSGSLAAYYTGFEHVLLSAWINTVLRPLLAIILLLLFLHYLDPSTEIAFLAQILGALFAVVVLIILRKNRVRILSDERFAKSKWWSEKHRKLIQAGVVMGGTQLLINLTTQIDILILTALASPEDVAHYYAAARAALVVSVFFGSSAMVVEPQLARLFASGNLQNVSERVRVTALVGIVTTFSVSIVIIFFGHMYLALYGPDFLAALPALMMLVFSLAIFSLFGPAQVVLRAGRQDKSILYVTAICLFLNLLVSILLVPLLGMIGAAIGTGLQFVAYGMILATLVSRRLGVHSDVLGLIFRGKVSE